MNARLVAHRNAPVSVETINTTTASLVPTSVLRAQVGQVLTDDDAMLLTYEQAAQGVVADFIGRPLLTTTRRAVWDVPTRVLATVEPIVSVSSLVFVDSSGTEHTIDSGLYRVDTTGKHGSVRLQDDATWPVSPRPTEGVVLTYTTGYDAASVPVPLTHAVLLLVGLYYSNRTPTSQAAQHQIPFGIKALVRQFTSRVGVG